jgi:hypothetical protein
MKESEMATINVTPAGAASTAETVIQDIMKVEPMVISAVGMFVPGAAPIAAMVQPIILMAVPYIERALDDIAKGNGGDILSALIELVQHVSAGQPNSPILSSLGAGVKPDMPPAPSGS